MAGTLQLTFDAGVQILGEPGYHYHQEGRDIVRGMKGKAFPDSQGLWADRWSQTIMLRPAQRDTSNWFTSAESLNYVIRLSQMQAAPGALAANLIWEQAYQQNANNQWIFHSPITPTAPVVWPAPPGQPDLSLIDVQSGISLSVTSPNPPSEPGEFPRASATDAKWVCWTKENLPPNCPLYFRWHVPNGNAGHPAIYILYAGQCAYVCGPTHLEVYLDSSPHQDWTAVQRIFQSALFGGPEDDPYTQFGDATDAQMTETDAHDVGLMILPFHRNMVYVESSYGLYGVFAARPKPIPLVVSPGGNPTDWDITSGNKVLAIAALTPGTGHFQVSKLKFFDNSGTGGAAFTIAPFTIDYAPANPVSIAANIVIDGDIPPNGGILRAENLSTPPIYPSDQNPINGDCQPLTSTFDVSNLTRQYGMNFYMQPGAFTDHPSLKIYTPQLFGFSVQIPQTSLTWPNTATTILEHTLAAPSARIERASVSVSLNHPGRFDADVDDIGNSLAALYGRTYFPIFLDDTSGVPGPPATSLRLWSGISDPLEVSPYRADGKLTQLRVHGTDWWKWLSDTAMRDTRDWTGYNHVYVMQFVVKLAGLSIAGWEGPADDSNNGIGGTQPALGGLNAQFLSQVTGPTLSTAQQPLKPVWRPNFNPPDSYATYLRRIAERFSAWDFGFHADGTPYYHPYNYFTASEVTFFKNRPEGQPSYMRPVEYRSIEPDANIVQGACGQAQSNTLLYSTPLKDYASLMNPAAVNYIGKPKFIIFTLPGALSCDELSRCVKAVFLRARRRHRMLKFKADYYPALKVGHCCQLEGISGTWRVQSFKVDFIRHSTVNFATYDCELVETGYGT